MLHARRKKLRALEEAEAAGETFWTTQFSPEARTRLATMAELVMVTDHGPRHEQATQISMSMRLEVGRDFGIESVGDVIRSIREDCPDELMPSLIEAFVQVQPDFDHFINTVLSEHRISFELIEGQMIEFDSMELHREVVGPALRLLSGRSGWDKVETAYQDALREISEGHAADAITDAGTALQEALTLLGCQGNALGPLVHSARKNGLLAPHDTKLADGIEKIADWVSADRSTTGDSHRAGTGATRDDAWFTVHVVGALILRLAGTSRT